MHRQIHKSRHIYVLIVTSIIFTLGVLIGAQFEQFRIEKIQEDISQETTRYQEIQSEIDYINFLLENREVTSSTCGILKDSFLTSVEKLDDSVFALENYESTATFRLEDYNSLKNQFFNLQARYYTLSENINIVCPNSFNTILYFYADAQECPECEDQGVILDHIKKKYRDDVMIYSFNTQSSTNIVELLKSSNGVDTPQTPSLIINQNTTLSFSSINAIEEELRIN